MSCALVLIDVRNEYFSGAFPITHPAGHLERLPAALHAPPEASGRLSYSTVSLSPKWHSFKKALPAGNCARRSNPDHSIFYPRKYCREVLPTRHSTTGRGMGV